jgi:hypothetical protein
MKPLRDPAGTGKAALRWKYNLLRQSGTSPKVAQILLKTFQEAPSVPNEMNKMEFGEFTLDITARQLRHPYFAHAEWRDAPFREFLG